MKNIKKMKIFYFLIVLTVLSAILYKEKAFLAELSTLKNEQKEREKVILQNINENYKPRKEDFYKEKNKNRGL